MALRFAKLSRPAIRALSAGQKITEHGITVERLSNGDAGYSINVMVDGQRIHRVVGRESEGVRREQAEQLIEKLRTEAREDRLNLPKGRKMALSFDAAATDYLKKLDVEGGKGVARKRQHIVTWLTPALGKKRLDGISESDVKGFIESRRRYGAKDSTINRELATLSHLLRCAVRWKWIGRDKIPTIDRLREGAGRIIALSPAQCDGLLQAALGDQDSDLWLFVLVCLQTSMRHGEARRLRWEHYDAHRRRFYIPEAKAGEREQPVPVELAGVLEGVMEAEKVSTGYVFKGGPGSKTGYRHTFRKAFARAVETAGLDRKAVTPHVMRHTAITRLVKAGVDLPTVQRVSGHKTISMVLRYAHVDGVHVDNAVNHLGFAATGSTSATVSG
jgi:integrase